MFKTQAGLALIILALAGCSRDGELTAQGITVTRSACPAVAIPTHTGDITLFSPAESRDASAIDVVAQITNLRSTCDDTGEYIVSTVTFDVQAQRRNTAGARDVTIPYFATVVQGGNNVVTKSVGQTTLRFTDGAARASASGTATGQVLRSAATLPDEVRREINRPRKAGDPDAAVDPLARPDIRAAVTRATFEMLVGFQLTDDQLRYNVTR